MVASKKSYAERKAAAERAAIEWSSSFDERTMSYGELAEQSARFEKIGRRYGLLREFRENGIC